MKLKKGFAMVLATTMCFGLVACGDSGKGTEAAITEASSERKDYCGRIFLCNYR